MARWTQQDFKRTLTAQIAWVETTKQRFLATDGRQDSSNEHWVDWQIAMRDEMNLRCEYAAAYGEMYDAA